MPGCPVEEFLLPQFGCCGLCVAREHHVEHRIPIDKREVEYFKGVLILTTNRVVAFDAAVLSRVQHAASFGVVNRSIEAKIFRLWFQRAKKLGVQPDKVEEWTMSFKKEKKRSFCLNGSEIWNVFLMTQDLHEDGSIQVHDLKRVCRWKIIFRGEMNKQTTSAENLLDGPRD